MDDERLEEIVDAIDGRVTGGAQVVLVSSGAIAAGLRPLGLRSRPRDLATQQAAASVGQGLLVARYTAAFAARGRTVGQVLLTSDDVVRRAHYRNAQRTFDRLLSLGVSRNCPAMTSRFADWPSCLRERFRARTRARLSDSESPDSTVSGHSRPSFDPPHWNC